MLYRAAVSEINRPGMAKRLSGAEGAVVERMHTLFRETGSYVEEPQHALDDATYDVREWKVVVENRTRTA